MTGLGVACMFTVAGLPIPQGWVRAFSVNGRTHYAHGSPGLAKWRKAVNKAAREAMVGKATGEPVTVALDFHMPRPQAHTGARGLKPWAADLQPTKRPDLDRLVRAVLDAITGPIILDDSQVVRLTARKVYAPGGPGVGVFVYQEPTPLVTEGFLDVSVG